VPRIARQGSSFETTFAQVGETLLTTLPGVGARVAEKLAVREAA